MGYFGLLISYIWLCICILYIVWYNANCVFSQYTIFWWIWSTINFFPSKGSLTLFQIRINFNLDIDKYLISAVSINNRIAKLISSISLENWGYINFPSLSVLFPCAPSHTAWLFEKNYFELKTSSFCFRMCLSLTRQLMPPEKMVTSAAKFNILILWYPVCTPLIPCHSHRS